LKILDRKASKGTLTIRPNYYMKNLEYFYPQQKDDYFAKLYKEHFQLSLNSMKFIKMLNLDLVEKFLESHKLALKKRVFCNSIK
jgi:hypothetical protein